MKVFCINLERSRSRFKFMKGQFEKYNMDYEFFKATDGYQLSDEEIAKHYDTNNMYPRRQLNKGEIGCFLSHYKLIGEIITRNIPYALIMEDDVIISSKLSIFLDMLDEIIVDGEVYSLFASLPESVNFKLVRTNTEFDIVRPDKEELVQGAVAYIVTRSAAQTMHEKLLPINNVFDDWRWIVNEGYINQFNVVYPHPVDLVDWYSDIHERKGGWTLALKKVIMEHNIPGLSHIIKQKRRKERLLHLQSKVRINGKEVEKFFT